jgi:hypothetical protein
LGFVFGANDWGFVWNNVPVLRFNLFLFKEKRKRIFTATGAKFGKNGAFLAQIRNPDDQVSKETIQTISNFRNS